MKPRTLEYALVTAARNEAEYIEFTLQSVVGQTKLPVRWIVVSDGSTDETEEIVQKYARGHPWIELLRLADREQRNFAAKARAFNTGCQRLGHISCDIIGNLDADVSFEKDYFAFLLDRFIEMPDLGVAGTPFRPGHYNYDFANIEHVSGPCQLFRRECLSEIGGYVPVEGGGIDWIAVTSARMKGWKTRTFLEKVLVHHREMGSAGQGPCGRWFRRGQEDYLMGGHPLWQLARSAYQMRSCPYVVGGLMLLLGYAHAFGRRGRRPVSAELVQFHRKEQMRRLIRAASSALGLRI
jgi:glycosyltransferase involved in cell wall biosynthesis